MWQAYQNWSRNFAALGIRLTELHLQRRGLWKLKLAEAVTAATDSATDFVVAPTPITVTVAEQNADARIRQFAQVLRRQLRADFPAMRSVDLRHPNGFRDRLARR